MCNLLFLFYGVDRKMTLLTGVIYYRFITYNISFTVINPSDVFDLYNM